MYKSFVPSLDSLLILHEELKIFFLQAQVCRGGFP